MSMRLALVGLTVSEPETVATAYRHRAGLAAVGTSPFFVTEPSLPPSDAPSLALLPLGWEEGGGVGRRRGATQLIFWSRDVDAAATAARRLGYRVVAPPPGHVLQSARVDADCLGVRLHFLPSALTRPALELLGQLRGAGASAKEVPRAGTWDFPLDHLAIDVLEPAAARELVEQVLGYRLVDEMVLRHPSGDARVRVLEEEGTGFQIVLGDTDARELHPIARQIAQRGGPGIHHLAHRVFSLEASCEEVSRRGAKVIGAPQDAPGLRQVFTQWAEDGVLHELIERKGRTGFAEKSTAALMSGASGELQP